MADLHTEPISEIWQAIRNWMLHHVPIAEENWGFLPPATDRQMDQVVQETGIPLPEDLRLWLKIHNGQDLKNPFRWLPHGMAMLSCEMIIEQWHFWVGLYEKYGEDEFSHETYFQDKIRNIVFHPKRLIIAVDEGLAMLALDGTPGPAGTPGQVILDVDECTFIVGADSLTQFLEKYLRLMESGQIRYDSGIYEMMVPVDQNLKMEDLLVAD